MPNTRRVTMFVSGPCISKEILGIMDTAKNHVQSRNQIMWISPARNDEIESQYCTASPLAMMKQLHSSLIFLYMTKVDIRDILLPLGIGTARGIS